MNSCLGNALTIWLILVGLPLCRIARCTFSAWPIVSISRGPSASACERLVGLYCRPARLPGQWRTCPVGCPRCPQCPQCPRCPPTKPPQPTSFSSFFTTFLNQNIQRSTCVIWLSKGCEHVTEAGPVEWDFSLSTISVLLWCVTAEY